MSNVIPAYFPVPGAIAYAEPEPKFKVRVPWGAFDPMSGRWYPNPRLPMSADEQWRRNVENGYAKTYRRADE